VCVFVCVCVGVCGPVPVPVVAETALHMINDEIA
jgi:hypothetical protein